MPVHAITPDYVGTVKDRVENFHGNILVHIYWKDHLLFCAPIGLPLPPSMPFAALLADVLPGAYSQHPEWEAIDWTQAQWDLNHAPFTPDPAKSLAENGIVHKALLCLTTPGLTGLAGSCT